MPLAKSGILMVTFGIILLFFFTSLIYIKSEYWNLTTVVSILYAEMDTIWAALRFKKSWELGSDW